jgi:Ring hydroxylating alpha subunit (catalytic domain)
VEFTNIVMKEDADVCELNQRGLHAAPHQHGVVMPEEHLIAAFQEWVKVQLAAPALPGATTTTNR